VELVAAVRVVVWCRALERCRDPMVPMDSVVVAEALRTGWSLRRRPMAVTAVTVWSSSDTRTIPVRRAL